MNEVQLVEPHELPDNIDQLVELDNKIETVAGEALARIRWHATRNPDNSNRISAREYALRVGRGESTIKDYARAYERRSNDDQSSFDLEAGRRAPQKDLPNSTGQRPTASDNVDPDEPKEGKPLTPEEYAKQNGGHLPSGTPRQGVHDPFWDSCNNKDPFPENLENLKAELDGMIATDPERSRLLEDPKARAQVRKTLNHYSDMLARLEYEGIQ